MIIKKKGIENITNQQTVAFELDNSGGHLFSVLSELYSKPEESTLRELATNAADAHIMSNNQERPFIIKLPNKDKNIFNFSVRDFGPGLTHMQVLQIYKVYGRSTKTNSDKETGCLGLGSKSPFSISSTFYVKSFKDGICSQYTCSMGNDGIPQISETPIEFETFEENGLEVIVPIYKEMDFYKIIKNTLKYFKVKPLVFIQNGSIEQDIPLEIDWLELNPVKSLTPTISINEMFFNSFQLVKQLEEKNSKFKIPNEIIQLQIYYPVDKKIIFDTIDRFNKVYTNEENKIIEKFKIDDETIKIIGYLFEIGFQLHAEPGCIAFAPSRETIKYNELTLIYIIKELIKAAKLLKNIAIRKLNVLQTYEDCFDFIYLENKNLSNILRYFPTSYNVPILKESKLEFEKERAPGKFMGTVNTSRLDKGLMHYQTRLGPFNISLNRFKNIFFLYDTPKNYHYIDIWDTSTLNFSQYDNVMLFDFSTPFVDLFIRTMYRKLIAITLDQFYEELEKLIKYLFLETNDKEFMELKKNIPGFKFMLQNFNFDSIEINNLKKYREEGLKILLEKLEQLSIVDFFSIIDSSSSRLLNEKYKKIYNQWYSIRDITGFSIAYATELNEYNLKLKNISNEIEKYPVNETKNYALIGECSKSFLKLIRIQTKYKKNFQAQLDLRIPNLNLLLSKLNSIYMDDIVEILPLNSFFKEKDVSIVKYFSQIIMIYLFKLYPNEAAKQADYKIDRTTYIEEWLYQLGIPKKYIRNVKESPRYKKLRNSKKEKLNLDTNTKTFSSVYYYDFELSEELITTFKNAIFEELALIGKLFKAYTKLFIEFRKNNVIRTDKNSNFCQQKFEFIKNIHFDKEKIEEKIIDLENGSIFERYNKCLSLNNYIISKLQVLISKNTMFDYLVDSFKAEFKELYSDIIEVCKLSDSYSNSNFISYKQLRLGENLYLTIPPSILNKKDLTIEKLKEEFLFDSSLRLEISVGEEERFYTKLFNNYKVCDITEFKLNFGKDYLCGNEVIDKTLELKILQKNLGDMKTKKIRNTFLEDIGSERLLKIFKFLYPDILFIKGLSIPNKFKKECINPIMLLIKLINNKPFIELDSSRKYLKENTRSGENILLPSTFLEKVPELKVNHFTELITENSSLLNLLDNKNKVLYFMENFKIIKPIFEKIEDDYIEYLKLEIEPFSKNIRQFMVMVDPSILNWNSNFVEKGFTLNKLRDLIEDKEFIKTINRLDRSEAIDQTFKNFNIIRIFINGFLSLLYDLNLDFESFKEEKLNLENKYTGNKINLLINFEKKNNKLIELLKDIEDELKISARTKKINISELNTLIKQYLKPVRNKEKIIRFGNFNNLETLILDAKKKSIMHSKINKRTKKAEELKKLETNFVNKVKFAADLVEAMNKRK